MTHRSLSRRRLLQTAVAFTSTVAASRSVRLLAQNKAPQEAVQYQDSPKNGARCKDCRFFEEPASCERVEGEISPDGWCTLFTPK